ncbi:MAG: T9SS type A sorting domain-containing protein [Bacteroidetes bacterium]|nr:T9SS type A sorting domain-containing protein [Bacteroidota bacterium]MCC6654748.1 T9SS type A sorting domain-containing protein [Flavobacteriales bacterium]HMU14686.1 T9SS type A sorting domain-containing protein [Flavobacteriales bacterium]
MKRALLFPALVAAITTSAQIDTETGGLNNTCDPVSYDAIALDIPDTAGLHLNTDMDFFRVEVPVGGVLQATVSSTSPGASFVVEIRDGSCASATSATGLVGQDNRAVAVVCPGAWFVGVSRATGTAPIAYVLTATITNSGECGTECDNTMSTATPLTALDTVFETRLWGQNALIASGTAFPIPEDQDFYSLQTGACGGTLSIQVSDIPWNITLRVSCFEGTPDAPLHVWSFQRSGCISGDLNGAWTLEPNKTWWLRFHDESTEQENCNSSYDLSPDCFQVTLDFTSGCDGCDGGEANNLPAIATPLMLDTAFTTRLWGRNEQFATDSVLGRAEDQDIYALNTGAEGGTLNIAVTEIPEGITLRAGLYAGPPFTLEHMGTFQRQACFGGNLTGAWSVEAGTSYFLRLYDESAEDTICGEAYNMSDSCFTVSLSFAPGICGATLILTANEGPGPGEATAAVSNGTPPFTWAWSNGDTTQTADGLDPGTYTVTATDSAGCTGSTTVMVIGTSVSGREGNMIGIWPNPVEGPVTIRTANTARVQRIMLSDASGRIVASRLLTCANGVATLDLGGLESGTYLVRVYFDDGGEEIGRVLKR